MIRALKDHGVRHIFGYPGGAVLPIYDELFQQEKVKHILEQALQLPPEERSLYLDAACSSALLREDIESLIVHGEEAEAQSGRAMGDLVGTITAELETTEPSFQQLFQRIDLRPGAVSSIQTFGSFAANFHPHIHSLVTEGVFTPEGEFLPLPVPATSLLADIEERFRGLLLKKLHRAERLSEDFLNKLLGWNPSGFSVYANQIVFDDEPDRLERLARYLTRAPLGVEAVRTNGDGQVEVSTPPQPRTKDTVLRLDPLDWIHAICQQIPDRGQHLTRYYGAYANRSRRAVFHHDAPQTPRPSSEPQQQPDSASSRTPASRASWARLLRKVFELDPLLCPRCGTQMKVIAFITEPRVIDRIVSHLHASTSPARPPPSPASQHESVPGL